VFILNGVKVLCFDTLLQVLILKAVKVAVSVFLQPFAKCAPFEALGKQGKQDSATAGKLGLPENKGVTVFATTKIDGAGETMLGRRFHAE
jgi:hypothetical protein